MRLKKDMLHALLAPSLGLLLLAWGLGGCSGSQEDSDRPGGSGKDEEAFEINDESIGSNVDQSSFVQSLSNNRMTSHLVDPEKAKAVAVKIGGSIKGDSNSARESLEGLIAAERLANAPIERLLQHAERLADIELRQGIDKQIGDHVKLELALGALKQKHYGLATFFLEEILESKNRRVRAGAQNAMGLLALFDDRIPEAVQYWRNALAAVPGYEAALLNLGFISLRYASFNDAEKLLARAGTDWFAQSGKLVAARLIGSTGETARICNNLMAKMPNHKPTVFNCGIHEWQSNNNIAKAKKMLGQALNIRGGPPAWDTQGYKTLESIQ